MAGKKIQIKGYIQSFNYEDADERDAVYEEEYQMPATFKILERETRRVKALTTVKTALGSQGCLSAVMKCVSYLTVSRGELTDEDINKSINDLLIKYGAHMSLLIANITQCSYRFPLVLPPICELSQDKQ